MKTKPVIFTIDDAFRLMKDYTLREDIPKSAKPLKIMIHPATHRIAVLAESEDWREGLTELQVRFRLKRINTMGPQ